LIIIAKFSSFVNTVFQKNTKTSPRRGEAGYNHFVLAMHSISMLSPIGSAETSTQVRAGKLGANASA